ncbi:MAG: hypothetical protein ACFFDH_14295 [Promethearchaeota archaeon]
MVRLLIELPRLFRERYLDTHENYLNSIAEIAYYLYFKDPPGINNGCESMVKKLLNAGNFTEQMVDDKFESIYFRNLRNAWYHELVLNYPQDDEIERTKFAPWKIVQCYYCILAGISALIRCFYSGKLDRHNKIFSIFTNDFLNNKKRRQFFLPPYNYYLDQHGNLNTSNNEMIEWEYGRKNHIPNIQKCLESIHIENRRTSIPHYLIDLRNWAQYEDSYLFFQLYGPSVKVNLDFSLGKISYGYMVQVEFFLINLFGWKTLKLQFDTFIEKVTENLGIRPFELVVRYQVYAKKFRK